MLTGRDMAYGLNLCASV